MSKPVVYSEDVELNEMLKKVKIDLPSSKEIYDNFPKNVGAESTDLAKLTGISDSCYFVSDINENDNFNIVYIRGHSPSSSSILEESDGINFNRYYRHIGMRPILRFEDCPELFDLIITKEDGTKAKDGDIVTFGKLPLTALKKNDQHFYNQIRREKKLKKSKERYTFDGTRVWSLKADFVPLVYNPYEFDGSLTMESKDDDEKIQCIDWIVRPDYQIEGWIGDSYRVYNHIHLSNGEAYTRRDNVWLQVCDVDFIVNVETKTLLAKNILVGGIQYANYSRKYDALNYSKSNVKHYLDFYLKPALLQGTKIKRKELPNIKKESEKPKKVLEQKVSVNDKTKAIIDLRNEIKEHLKYYLGDRDFLGETDRKISEYNDRVLHPHLDLEIYPGTNDPKNLYARLKLELEDFVKELRENSEKVRSYFEMIDILNECKKDDINQDLHEICGTMKIAKEIVSKYILNEEEKDKLTIEYSEVIARHINACKEKLEEYKNGLTNDTKQLSKLVEEFEKDIRPFLNNLHKAASEQNVVDRIIKGVNQSIKNIYDEKENLRKIYFVKQIDDELEKIRSIANEEEIKELDEICEKYNPKRSSGIHKVVGDYTDMLRDLLAFDMKVEARVEKEKAIQSMVIEVPEESEIIANVNKR